MLTLRSIAELSGILAFDAWRVLYADAPDANWLYQYQVLSGRRLKEWCDAITAADALEDRQRGDERLVGIAEEIVTWDIASRLSAAWLAGHCTWNRSEQAGRTARRIISDQCHAKQTVFASLLARTPSLGTMARFNRLRRLCERWTDQLIGGLMFAEAAREFAISDQRMEEFRQRGARSRTAVARHFTLIGLGRAVPATPIADGRRDLQQDVARHLLSTTSRLSFHDDGRLMDAEVRRVARGIADRS